MTIPFETGVWLVGDYLRSCAIPTVTIFLTGASYRRCPKKTEEIVHD
jgi:hypothetical protein